MIKTPLRCGMTSVAQMRKPPDGGFSRLTSLGLMVHFQSTSGDKSR